MKLFLCFAVVILISFAGCGNRAIKNKEIQHEQSKSSIDNEFLNMTNMKLTEKEWQEIISSYDKIWHADDNWTEEDGDADMLARVVNSNDIALGGKLEYYALKEKGLLFLSDSDYVNRIKYVFGIDLNDKTFHNNIRKYEDYVIYLMPNSTDEDDDLAATLEFYSERRNCYFFKKYSTYNLDMPLVTIIDMQKSTDKDNVYLKSSCSDLYHLNNYILHGNQGSLVWLISNGYGYILGELLINFGYDEEEKINKAVLNDENLDFRKLFASRDIYGNLQLRTGLLQTVENFSTKDFSNYYKLLENYAYVISGNESAGRYGWGTKEVNSDFTLAERHKILAYVVNTLQPIYEKFNPQCIGGEYGVEDKYDLGVTDAFWNIMFDDHELIIEIEKNNYYGLPNLKKLIEKMHADERFINPDTGAFEPWIFSPNEY